MLRSSSKKPKMNLFEYIYGVMSGQLDDSDEDSNQSNEMIHLGNEGSNGAAGDSLDLDELMSDEINEGPKGGLTKEDSIDYKANTP